MVNETELIQIAAGIDFDSIAPFVFVILIVASQIFGILKKKKRQGNEEPDVDAIDRARQIREEIRRKIEERRQEMDPGTTRTVNAPQKRAYDPTLPDGKQRRTVQMPQQPVHQRPVVQRTEPARPVVQAAPAQSVRRQPSLEEQLAEQRKRLELAQRQQKEARSKGKQMLKDSRVETHAREERAWGSEAASGNFKQQLLGGLMTKNGLRKAVLYREILDRPLGLRD